ncbi:hypothetical protein DW1_0183 [Proteiniborus sp. DW1]|uniref:Spo0E family sporulation regulatory protein-aspartic acid phosphatase n=1 Tax=Proteiniborus sp. DW1 TaxID=1889883 RepID=UPI00092DF074|nr:Spo0E family sporulation regulatory protein-aspartic acid phosphatase [Proteiniborus sp. DW1]SCG81804.1 hypothetical protein DW1_0183 [Proteiniborus sp. DW1]
MNGAEGHVEELKEQLNKLSDDINNYDLEKLLNISLELDKVIYEYGREKQRHGFCG